MGEIDAAAQWVRECRRHERNVAVARLIGFTHDDDVRDAAFDMLLDLVRDGTVSTEELAPHIAVVGDTWKRVHKQAKPMQQDEGKSEWLHDEEYAPLRCSAERLLDLLGHFPIAVVRGYLREGLVLTDPRLKAFSAISLLRNGEAVDPDEIEQVARSNEMRLIFWKRLRECGMESFMPQCWSSPEQLAASDLAGWVAHPLEMGVLVEDIELMNRFQVKGDLDEALVGYLFRFREYPKPWEPGEGWMAGIAGPFQNGEAVGSPWSSFDRWDSMSPEEHIEKLWTTTHSCQSGG